MRLPLPILLLCPLCAQGDPTELDETVVIAERLPANWEQPSFDNEALEKRSPLSLDQLLLENPAVSLFRRQDATFANPTAAGISLRRTGATATARTLVLRDGIPQNDPFGGWISWLRYRPSQLEAVRILPSSAATAWGNQSAAGTIQLTSRDPWTPFHQLTASVGSRNTWSLDTTHNFISSSETAALQVSAFTLQSEGHSPLLNSQRGSIDRSLSLKASGLELKNTWRPATDFQLESSLSAFREERGNGTALTRNATEALDFSLRATWEKPSATYQATGYYQQRDFAAVFTSQATDRTSERVALDQFDVPGRGIGGSFISRFSHGENLTLALGVDARHLDGETNERIAFDNRIRTAGGEQTFLAAFVQASTTLPSDIELNASVRLDYYQSSNGSLREVRPDGSLRADENFRDRASFEPSFGLSLGKQITSPLHLSAGISSSFRAPTLNELYRGFRVRSDITNANAALDPERFYSAEFTATYTPNDSFEWSITFLGHYISDAIANVPLAIDSSGTTAQRLNVDAARVYGLESRFHYQPCAGFQATLAYQWTETDFNESNQQPLLENQPFPHSPRHRFTANLNWQATSSLALGAFTSFASRAYDDALATRRLDSYWTSSISAEYQATEHLALIGRIDNFFGQDTETGLASNDLLSLAAPRTFSLTARYQW